VGLGESLTGRVLGSSNGGNRDQAAVISSSKNQVVVPLLS
jgi:hypothetical protein